MIGFKVNQAKSFFFDRPIVDALDKATRANLSKAVAFIRRTAKGLLRKGKKSSKPGSSPKSHTEILKDFLFFAYDPHSHGAVVGPAKTNQIFFKGNGQPASGTVPGVLEFGGTIGILEAWLPNIKKWVRADLRSKRRLAERQTRIRKVKIAARPYMRPAMMKEAPKFPQLWANTLKSAA